MTMRFSGGIILKEHIIYVKEAGRFFKKKMIAYTALYEGDHLDK